MAIREIRVRKGLCGGRRPSVAASEQGLPLESLRLSQYIRLRRPLPAILSPKLRKRVSPSSTPTKPSRRWLGLAGHCGAGKMIAVASAVR